MARSKKIDTPREQATPVMTAAQQRAALHANIWSIADKLRGAVEGWSFKQYVLGALFYRFLSEHFAEYIKGEDENFDYATYTEKIDQNIIDEAVKDKGYFIYPDQLFCNVAAHAKENEKLNTDLHDIFDAIEKSAEGTDSEDAIKGLFKDFDTQSVLLGDIVKEKNERLVKVLDGIAKLDLGPFSDSNIDVFGDAYEFLISNYAANAGKSGGEFFTPQTVSKLIARLAVYGLNEVNKVYDPACGSGSLLLQTKKYCKTEPEEGFWGQEINYTTYNLARMNMFLHGINYNKFKIKKGDTLTKPDDNVRDGKPFDVIVSNPPYSVSWVGTGDPTLINDERFAPAGVLAPKTKADFAFVMHSVNYLSSRGRAAIVCFPGIFYRGGAEQKIRQYLVDNNFVETVIALAPNLFFGTSIAVNILVLSKHKENTDIQFINASGLFKKETNNNVLTDEHSDRIMEVFVGKADVEYFAKSVSVETVAANGYNLSVGSYVEEQDTREVVDIVKLNAELKATAERINRLRTDIDSIINEIGAAV